LADDVPVLMRLRACGYEVMVVSPNPIDFEIQSYHLQESYRAHPELQAGARLALLEHSLLISRLKRAAVQVVDWKISQPLDKTIHTALMQQPVSRRIMEGIL